MYALIRHTSLRELLLQQAPALVASLAVAELFYKFGSFLLECLAFLATWFVVDLVATLVLKAVGAGTSRRHAAG